MKKKPISRSDRLYRFLLRMFPFDFRRDYGKDMEALFKDERKHAQKIGSTAETLRLWSRTLAGFLRTAPLEHVDVFRRDVRFGMRSLKRDPGFAAVAIAALAIGIGANIAVFGLANELILKPLPVADPDGLVQVFA